MSIKNFKNKPMNPYYPFIVVWMRNAPPPPVVSHIWMLCPCLEALSGGDFGAFRGKSIAEGRMSLQEVSESLQSCPHCVHFLFLFVITAIISWHLDLATCSYAFLTMVDSPSGAISLNELFLLKLPSVMVFYHEGTGTSTHTWRRFSFSCASPYKPSFWPLALRQDHIYFFPIINDSKWIAWHEHNLYSLLMILN